MWYNKVVMGLLKSRWHSLLSSNVMLITLVGRKSGNEITFPVNYRQRANHLWVLTYRSRSWWRNLVGGGEVTLWWRGKPLKTSGIAITEEPAARQELAAFLADQPNMARLFKVELGEDGLPTADALTRLSQEMLVVQFPVPAGV